MELGQIQWAGFFCSACMAIVFLQSSLDKIFNYKRELGWVQQKFTKSALYNYVSTLFFVLTFSELLSGLLSFAGMVSLLIGNGPELAYLGALCSSLTMLMLIFGQRITKDYTGAASLMAYFITSVLGVYFLSY